MIVHSVKHKGLKRFLEREDTRGLQPDLIDKIAKVTTALALAYDMDSFQADAPMGWRIHKLSGDKKGLWSVTLSGNWRMTFTEENKAIHALNLEDYH